jgi:hypothetical protein
MTDYVSPKDLVQEAVQLAGKKAGLSVRDRFAAFSPALATSLVFVASSQDLIRLQTAANDDPGACTSGSPTPPPSVAQRSCAGA